LLRIASISACENALRVCVRWFPALPMANPRAVAVQAAVVAVWIAVPLLLIAVLLFA